MEGVVRGGAWPEGVWPEEGRGHRRVWSDEGHGLHVRPVTSHHHNHAPPFDIRSWLKAKGELVLDDLDPAASYRPVGKCPGRVWLAQRTLRKEPTFPTFSHPGQAAPRNGLDHSKSKQPRLPRAASWAQQTSANLLPQDRHLERCFQNYYPLKTIIMVSIKPAPNGTYLLFPSSHLDTDGVMYVNIPSVRLSVPITISCTPWVLQRGCC